MKIQKQLNISDENLKNTLLLKQNILVNFVSYYFYGKTAGKY